jgi:hypothetical protein
MTAKATLTAHVLAAATFAIPAFDVVQAAKLASRPAVAAPVVNPPHVADFKLPPQQRYAGGVGHTPTAKPIPPCQAQGWSRKCPHPIPPP